MTKKYASANYGLADVLRHAEKMVRDIAAGIAVDREEARVLHNALLAAANREFVKAAAKAGAR